MIILLLPLKVDPQQLLSLANLLPPEAAELLDLLITMDIDESTHIHFHAHAPHCNNL